MNWKIWLLGRGAAKHNAERWTVVVLLAVFITLALTATLKKSPTADENFHLLAGYSYLRWGDFRINPEHPPLAKLLAALPLLALDIDDTPLTREQRDRGQASGMYSWSLANRWLFSHNDAERLLFYARIPMVGLGALLGLCVFLWTRELFGYYAGIAALSFLVFDPNFLAHSAIVHTDVPFTLMIFAGTYFFWRTLNEVTWLNWSITMGVFALAAITKFSFVAILPIWSILGVWTIIFDAPMKERLSHGALVSGRWQKLGWIVLIVSSALVCAYLAIWWAYGFHYDAFVDQQSALGISPAITPASWLKPFIPYVGRYQLLPEAWFAGLVYALSAFNRTSYLLGKISSQGFWLFFPISILVKTPLPTLAALCIAGYFVLRDRALMRHAVFVWIPPLLYLALAIYSHMNIGLRHVLPIYPFLFVLCGGAIAKLWTRGSRLKQAGVILLAVWLVWSVGATYPGFLGFFNEAVARNYRHSILVDSNLDWGQDLKGLKKWMDDQGVKKIQLAYFGTADPAYYGIDSVHKSGTLSVLFTQRRVTDTFTEVPYIAISLTHLVGLYLGPTNPYAEYLRRQPVARIGDSIWIFRTDGLS